MELERKLVELDEELALAIQGDFEQGAAWLNDVHSAEFKQRYPNIIKWFGKFRKLVDSECPYRDEEK